MRTKLARAFLALTMLFTSAPALSEAAQTYHARASAPSNADMTAWLRASWVGRCFPEVAYALSDGAGSAPTFAPTTPVRRIDVSAWSAAFETGHIAPFLAADVVVAQYASSGDRKRVLAAAFDTARATFVFQQLGVGDIAAGYIGHLSGAPTNLPTIDARRATGHDPIALSASPPGPSRANLRAMLGASGHAVKACGLSEYTYRETGDTPVLLYAICDAAGTARAMIVERATE